MLDKKYIYTLQQQIKCDLNNMYNIITTVFVCNLRIYSPMLYLQQCCSIIFKYLKKIFEAN